MIGIYGASGFIGRHLVARLLQEERRVRAISRHVGREAPEPDDKHLEVIEADLTDPIAMASSLVGLDTVVQLISTSSPGLGNRFNVSDIRDNVIPHVEFLKSCVDAGIKRYIFLSSGGTVYGPTSVSPIPEDHPTNPISSHGLTKLTIEKYIQMHGHVDGLDYIVLRLANAYGPGQAFRKGQGLIPAVLDRHARGEAIQIIGDGSARRDYVYIDDIVDACIAAIDAPGRRQLIVNIGSGESKSVVEVLDAMETTLGTTFHRDYVKARRTDVDINQLDIGRAAETLDWRPRTSFSDGLARTLAKS